MTRTAILFATVFLAFNSFGQFGSISNGGFENWYQETLFGNPEFWQSSNNIAFYGTPTVVESNDAQDGLTSAEIRSVPIGQDTLGGYIFHGDAVTGAGIPYSSNFEAVSFQYKSNLALGDTLYMILIRYNSGTMVGYQVVPAAYGIANVWTPNLLYVGNVLMDELFIGFTMNSPYGGTTAPGSWARIDNVQMLAGGAPVTNVPNPSFENWQYTTVEEAQDWYSLNYFLGAYGLENATKTTDAYAGSYAMQMNTIDTGTDTIASILSLAPINLFDGTPFNNAPYNGTPTLFSGAYKYIGQNGDQCGISITFFENGIPIGIHTELFSTQANYTPFASALSIAGTPDSIQFVVYSGDNPGSVLKLDELQFSGGGVGVFDEHLPEFALFPNPAHSEAWLVLPNDQSYRVQLFAPDGRLVQEWPEMHGKLRFDVSEFAPGVYSVQISDGFLQRIQKMLVD